LATAHALPADDAAKTRVRLVGEVADVADDPSARRDQDQLAHAALVRLLGYADRELGHVAVGVIRDVFGHWKIAWIRRAAGPSVTTKIAGKMRSTTGKTSFTGAFCARSSASCRLSVRMSVERLRSVWPI